MNNGMSSSRSKSRSLRETANPIVLRIASPSVRRRSDRAVRQAVVAPSNERPDPGPTYRAPIRDRRPPAASLQQTQRRKRARRSDMCGARDAHPGRLTKVEANSFPHASVESAAVPAAQPETVAFARLIDGGEHSLMFGQFLHAGVLDP